MRILPAMSLQMPKLSNTKMNFGAKIHDIEMPDAMADEINSIKKAASNLIGKEVHGQETSIGNKKAVYDKYLGCFNVDIDENASLMVNTYKNKLHSVAIHTTTKSNKGTAVVRTVHLYEGCPTAKDPIPSVYYAAHIAKQPMSGYSVKYKPGDEVSKAQGAAITNVLYDVATKLGLN